MCHASVFLITGRNSPQIFTANDIILFHVHFSIIILPAQCVINHTIHSILDSNSAVCGVFLDLSKAFDSVPHQPLLDMLASSSLPPHLLNWIHSYLLNRSQKVVLNGSTSSSLHVSSGVPQGSILGPLLFLIYINGVTDVPLSPLTHLILYADDIFIFRPVNSPSDMSILQSDLNNISSWLTSNLLQLNSSKSKYIFFSHKSPSHFDSFPPLSISQSPIDRVSSFCYLGVTLSSSLSWSPHISSVCSKSRKILGILFRHFHPHSSPSTLINLYKSLVRPHLEYCSIVWDPSSKSLSQSLESVQLFALKLASNFRPLISSIKCTCKISSLVARRHNAKLVFFFKLLHNRVFFPSSILLPSPPPSYPLRSYHPNNIIPLKTKNKQSYFPHTIQVWNSLPPPLKETFSISHFIYMILKLNNFLSPI